jgi:hypothetical protein
VVLAGTTPGGEFKVASPAGPASRYSQVGFGRYEPGNNYYAQQRPASSNGCMEVPITTARATTDKRRVSTSRADIEDELWRGCHWRQ